MPILKAADGAVIEAILLTHGHFDHIGAVRPLMKAFPNARLLIHALDAPMLSDPGLNAGRGLLGREITAPAATDFVREGEKLSLAGLSFSVLHTPGHTPGGVCYLIEKEKIMFSGDTLFCLTAGRTDLPGGNDEQMMRSLRRLAPLVREKGLHAGH